MRLVQFSKGVSGEAYPTRTLSIVFELKGQPESTQVASRDASPADIARRFCSLSGRA